MKKNLLPALALTAASLFTATSAQAKLFQLDFKADGYASVLDGLAAPQTLVTGWFQYEASAANAQIDALTDVSLSINGHTYSAAEVGAEKRFGNIVFGEKVVSDIGVANAGVNDFTFSFSHNPTHSVSYYTSAGTNSQWTPSEISYSIHSISAVPEPTSMLMLLAGLGVVGAVARRRNQQG